MAGPVRVHIHGDEEPLQRVAGLLCQARLRERRYRPGPSGGTGSGIYLCVPWEVQAELRFEPATYWSCIQCRNHSATPSPQVQGEQVCVLAVLCVFVVDWVKEDFEAQPESEEILSVQLCSCIKFDPWIIHHGLPLSRLHVEFGGGRGCCACKWLWPQYF